MALNNQRGGEGGGGGSNLQAKIEKTIEGIKLGIEVREEKTRG